MIKEVELNDGIILLRRYRADDAESLFEAARESFKELNPWMPWCHSAYSINESRKWVEERAAKWENAVEYEFAITDFSTGNYLGGCGINNIHTDTKIANLGYWVKTSRTKQGVATRAALLLARFGIDQLMLNRIEIVIAVPNLASQRVAQKVGAFREGIERNRIIIEGKPCDAVMFSLIPKDLENANPVINI